MNWFSISFSNDIWLILQFESLPALSHPTFPVQLSLLCHSLIFFCSRVPRMLCFLLPVLRKAYPFYLSAYLSLAHVHPYVTLFLQRFSSTISSKFSRDSQPYLNYATIKSWHILSIWHKAQVLWAKTVSYPHNKLQQQLTLTIISLVHENCTLKS